MQKTVELLYRKSSDNPLEYDELTLEQFEQIKYSLLENVKLNNGTLKAFLDGHELLMKYPDLLPPRINDNIFTVIVDNGDRKQGYDLYESEFRRMVEGWRQKKWGISATDMFGNAIVREEYDYISGLTEMGAKIYADNRRVYNIKHEVDYKEKKGIFKEIYEGIARDIKKIFGFLK